MIGNLLYVIYNMYLIKGFWSLWVPQPKVLHEPGQPLRRRRPVFRGFEGGFRFRALLVGFWGTLGLGFGVCSRFRV